MQGHRLAVVDGHEIHGSDERCGPKCQKRPITVNGQTRPQYSHRAVVFQRVGPGSCWTSIGSALMTMRALRLYG